MYEFLEYPDPYQQAQSLAHIVAGQLRDCLEKKGRATLAVPGGTTPALFLNELSLQDMDWHKVSVLLTDERFVPESDERSNTRLLKEQFVKNAASKATIVPLYAPAETPESVLESLSATIRAALPLDICVLGMGEDMHTASLFPGGDNLALALQSTCKDILLPMRASGAPEIRLTLTAPILLGASHIHLLIKGDAKRAALLRAEAEKTPLLAPVKILFEHDGLSVHHTCGEGK